MSFGPGDIEHDVIDLERSERDVTRPDTPAGEAEPERRRSLAANTSMNLVSTVVSVVTSLAITPFIVDRVGLKAFGLWSIVLAILQYAQISDGSFPTVTVRLVARALERRDRSELRATLATTMMTLGLIAALMTAAGIVVPWLLPQGLTAGLPSGWAAATRWAALSLAITTLARGLAGVTRGAHRWDLDAAVLCSSQIVGFAVTIPLLLNGGGLRALGMIAAVTSGVTLVGYAAIAAWMGALGRTDFRPRRTIYKELRQQGIALQVVGLVAATNAQADRLMLLPFASLSFIGAYALGSRIAVTLRGFPLSAFGPLMAKLSAADASGGPAAVVALYTRSLRTVADYAFPILLGAYFAAYPAVLAWLGPTFQISAAGAVLLGIGYAINVLTGPGTSAAIASGKAEIDRDYNLLGFGLNIALSVTLGLTFGAWGVVAATTLGLVISSGWLIHRVDQVMQSDVGSQVLIRRSLSITIIGVSLLAAATIVATRVLAPSGRMANLGIAAVSAIAVTLWVMRDVLIALRRGTNMAALRAKLL